MTTAYTRDQLDKMNELFYKRAPRLPNDKDKRRLPMVDAISGAGAPLGIWVRLHVDAGQSVLLFLNPVVALELMHGINMCAQGGGWWKEGAKFTGSTLPAPTAEQADAANEVISLTTAGAGDMMLVHFARRGGSKQMLGLWKRQAADLFLTINKAGEQFGWWDQDFQLRPAENSSRITDMEVLRAANQLMQQFPGTAEAEAKARSVSAYSVGDMFNDDLWHRIAKAIAQLDKAKPDNPAAIN